MPGGSAEAHGAARTEVRGGGWLWLAFLRAGLSAAMIAYAIADRSERAHPQPGYVRPAALALATVPAILALAQLIPRLRASRRAALGAFVLDAVAVLAMLTLYSFSRN